MIEILISGKVEKDFERIGVQAKRTYGTDTTEYGVYEVSEKDFKLLCDEPDEISDENWLEGGWRYAEGSNQSEAKATLIIKGKELRCWYNPIDDEEPYFPEYDVLLTYLCDEMGCSQSRNVCALTVDLAKYNGMKLSELFKTYQGLK